MSFFSNLIHHFRVQCLSSGFLTAIVTHIEHSIMVEVLMLLSKSSDDENSFRGFSFCHGKVYRGHTNYTAVFPPAHKQLHVSLHTWVLYSA